MIQANKQNLVIPRYFYAPAAPLQDIRPVRTGFQEPDVDQSRCPSMWPADCAVQVPISADSALQSGESPGLYGCSAHDAPWSLGIFWMRLPMRAAPMAPHGSPRGLDALVPGSVRVEIRNLCGLKYP